MSNFRVGMKVVCVQFDWDDTLIAAPGDNIIVGEVYTTTNVFVIDGDHGERVEMLELAELYQPGSADWHPGFTAECFRPAVEGKTSIEVLRQLLVPKRELAPIDQ
jgi:hypothetical protein